MPRAHGDSRGFTLTELLVVVAIIVLLTSIVVPNIAGRLTRARMNAAEDQIAEIEAALAAYHADFGTYPGDVFPTEDINNNGKLDAGEDIGVDVDRDGTPDYALTANGRIDKGDAVVNIDDLEWALKTTAKSGPYLNEIPLDPWGQRYVYYAPLIRPTNPDDFLYIDPTATMQDEDGLVTLNGRLPRDDTDKPRDGAATEDKGIAKYATTNTDTTADFGNSCADTWPTCLWAGADNGILDHGDDDNKNGTIQYYWTIQTSPAPQQQQALELGNADMAPDGLARNLGYYIYSVGRNKQDESATGYEDIGGLSDDGKPDNQLNSATPVPDDRLYVDPSPSRFDEDIDSDDSLDTGYEDTGIDGIPGTKDQGEDNWRDEETPSTDGTSDEDFSGLYNTAGKLDIGGDDINSWNSKRPWRDHASYGG